MAKNKNNQDKKKAKTKKTVEVNVEAGEELTPQTKCKK
jgi:hypothetical protein